MNTTNKSGDSGSEAPLLLSERIAEVLEGITPGEWQVVHLGIAEHRDRTRGMTRVAGTHRQEGVVTTHMGGTCPSADATFIAAAPALLREAQTTLRQQEEEIQRLRGCLAVQPEVTPKPKATPMLPFIHWSKDPLLPYAGCECVNCNEERREAKRLIRQIQEASSE